MWYECVDCGEFIDSEEVDWEGREKYCPKCGSRNLDKQKGCVVTYTNKRRSLKGFVCPDGKQVESSSGSRYK